MREAAALPLVSITAWEACDNIAVAEGDELLIFGGVGGVGHIAVQLAKARGANVVATVSNEEDAAVARALGADEIVNYRTEALEHYIERLTSGRGFAAVIDTVGGDNLANALAAAAPHGRIATTNARTTLDPGPLHAKALSLNAVFMLIPLLRGAGRRRSTAAEPATSAQCVASPRRFRAHWPHATNRDLGILLRCAVNRCPEACSDLSPRG